MLVIDQHVVIRLSRCITGHQEEKSILTMVMIVRLGDNYRWTDLCGCPISEWEL